MGTSKEQRKNEKDPPPHPAPQKNLKEKKIKAL
jgi:hypothetical protein